MQFILMALAWAGWGGVICACGAWLIDGRPGGDRTFASGMVSGAIVFVLWWMFGKG